MINENRLVNILLLSDNVDEFAHMKKEFNVVIEQDSEGFYVASVPELRGCHTQAKSLDELMEPWVLRCLQPWDYRPPAGCVRWCSWEMEPSR